MPEELSSETEIRGSGKEKLARGMLQFAMIEGELRVRADKEFGIASNSSETAQASLEEKVVIEEAKIKFIPESSRIGAGSSSSRLAFARSSIGAIASAMETGSAPSTGLEETIVAEKALF